MKLGSLDYFLFLSEGRFLKWLVQVVWYHVSDVIMQQDERQNKVLCETEFEILEKLHFSGQWNGGNISFICQMDVISELA
jgi:hypothetical protein